MKLLLTIVVVVVMTGCESLLAPTCLPIGNGMICPSTVSFAGLASQEGVNSEDKQDRIFGGTWSLCGHVPKGVHFLMES